MSAWRFRQSCRLMSSAGPAAFPLFCNSTLWQRVRAQVSSILWCDTCACMVSLADASSRTTSLTRSVFLQATPDIGLSEDASSLYLLYQRHSDLPPSVPHSTIPIRILTQARRPARSNQKAVLHKRMATSPNQRPAVVFTTRSLRHSQHLHLRNILIVAHSRQREHAKLHMG